MVNNMNNFKTRLLKWSELAQQDLYNLLQWAGFPIEIDNPHTVVCSASCDGKTVAYVVSEPVYLITNCALNPQSNSENDTKAGEVIDGALAVEAQRVGVGKLLIAIPEGAPKQPGEKCLRYIERKVSQPVNTQRIDATLQSPVAYIN
jgi:hypothetical protein